MRSCHCNKWVDLDGIMLVKSVRERRMLYDCTQVEYKKQNKDKPRNRLLALENTC